MKSNQVLSQQSADGLFGGQVASWEECPDGDWKCGGNGRRTLEQKVGRSWGLVVVSSEAVVFKG
jgi:hypothetical protein